MPKYSKSEGNGWWSSQTQRIGSADVIDADAEGLVNGFLEDDVVDAVHMGPITEDEIHIPPAQRIQHLRNHRAFMVARVFRLIVSCLLAGFLVAVALGYGIPWLFFPSATVTITPVAGRQSTHFSLTYEQAGVTQLQTLKATGTKTVATTGKGTVPSAKAHGAVTLNNNSSQPVFVPAQSLITANDSVQVTTDYAVTVPSGNPVGYTTVSATAVESGSIGNIAAGAVGSACCVVGIYAKNYGAFTGGQDAKTVETVAATDIAHAASSEQADLTQSFVQQYQQQITGDETLIQPLTCEATNTPSAKPGSQADSVTVKVNVSCHGFAYSQSSLQAIGMTNLQRAYPSYTLVNSTQQSTVKAATDAIQVTTSASMYATWTHAGMLQLAAKVAGMSVVDGTLLLQNQPGVAGVQISMYGRDQTMLPDAARITMQLSNIIRLA